MGILSDIGRSNMAQAGQTMFNDVLKYKQAERQDNLDAITAAHTVQSMDTQRQQLAIQQAHEQRAAEEYQQQQTQLNQFLPATYFFGSEDKWTPAQRSMFDDLKASNVLENRAGVDGVTRRNMPIVKDFMNRNPEQVANWGSLNIIQKSQEIGGLRDKMRTETDPETLKGLQAQVDAATANLTSLTNDHKTIIDNLPKVAEAKAIAAARASNYKTVQSDESPTGWAYINPDSGDITEGAPPPHNYNADTLYRSATLEERIRHNQVAESKATTATPHQNEIDTNRKVVGLQKDLNTRLNSTYKTYGLTGEDITKIMDGDTGIIRTKLNPQQATALDAEVGKALREYDNSREGIDGNRPMGTTKTATAPQTGGDYQQFKDSYETIRNAPNLDNAEKNRRINELNGRARKMGIIK